MRHAVIAENNSNTMVVTRNNSMVLSTDGGQTYTAIGAGLPGYSISDVVFAPNNDQIILITYERYQNDGNKVFISYNQGASWTNITGNLGDMPIRSAIIDHTPDQNIYLGAELGVYTKPMNGTTWTLYNPNLPNVSVRELEIQWATNTLRAITWGRGLWEYTLVGRNDYPNILTTLITDPPTDALPVETDPQDVTSVISYNGAISSAFVRWSVGSATYDSVIPMINIVDSTWQTQTPIPGTQEGNNVYFKVYAVGSNNDTTESYKFHYKTRPACISNGNMSWQTAVTLVNFDNINNATGKTQPYTDYRDSDSTVVMIGTTHDLTVNVNTDGDYTVNGMAWIDWNVDGDFTDPGEEYVMGSAHDTIDGPTTLSPLAITIPANATVGNVKMRVSARFGNAATPCETGYDGEVEDYKLVILPACSNTNVTLTEQACNTYTSPSGLYTYNTSGTYYDTLQNAGGCDSLITINLSLGNDQTSTIFEVACDSFVLDNQSYYTSGTYLQHLTTVGGCDSAVTLNLIVNQASAVSVTETACNSYTANGQTYTTSGTYVQTLAASTGCDSTVTLNLTIQSVDAMLTSNGPTLTATTAGATYLWLDCDNNQSVIPGETGQSFTATANGNYAVVVNDGLCSDTSACMNVTGIGLIENTLPLQMSVFPNPSDGSFTVQLGHVYQDVVVEVRDVLGKLIQVQQANGVSNLPIVIEEAAAVYFLTVVADDERGSVRVLVE